MQFTGFEAVKRQVIEGARPDSTRPASYDLTVGQILVDGRSHSSEVSINPQQTFIIVSQETVQMKPGLVGYVMPKTGLCNEGILALNTGLVDPGYSGPLSTIAINFSRQVKVLEPGRPFLRLVVNSLEGEGREKIDQPLHADSAETRRRRSSEFPGTFLDTPAVVRRVTDELLARQLNIFLLILAGATIVFALWNLGAYHLLGLQVSSIATSAEQRDIRELDRIESRIESIEAAVYRGMPMPPKQKAARP